jgi:hypothetical protein
LPVQPRVAAPHVRNTLMCIAQCAGVAEDTSAPHDNSSDPVGIKRKELQKWSMRAALKASKVQRSKPSESLVLPPSKPGSEVSRQSLTRGNDKVYLFKPLPVRRREKREESIGTQGRAGAVVGAACSCSLSKATSGLIRKQVVAACSQRHMSLSPGAAAYCDEWHAAVLECNPMIDAVAGSRSCSGGGVAPRALLVTGATKKRGLSRRGRKARKREKRQKGQLRGLPEPARRGQTAALALFALCVSFLLSNAQGAECDSSGSGSILPCSYGGCIFSKDASGFLERTGSCPTMTGALYLKEQGTTGLRDGVFSNMGACA